MTSYHFVTTKTSPARHCQMSPKDKIDPSLQPLPYTVVLKRECMTFIVHSWCWAHSKHSLWITLFVRHCARHLGETQVWVKWNSFPYGTYTILNFVLCTWHFQKLSSLFRCLLVKSVSLPWACETDEPLNQICHVHCHNPTTSAV